MSTAVKQSIATRRRVRFGLAPLEFVLALPLLLFVMALIVNFGWAATWRLRGEIVARDAAWSKQWPRADHLPPPTWPDDATYSVANDEQISLLDDPEIDHEVVRGPNFGDVIVHPVLDPDRTGAIRGNSEIDRTFPLLPGLGQYNSDPISHRILHPRWQCADEGYQNWFRRSKILYEWPEPGGGFQSAYDGAARTLQSYVQGNWEALRVLEADVDFIRYRGSAPDFHPRPPSLCEVDAEVIRRDAVEKFLIDYIDSRGELQLGEITRLPRTLTSAFLNLYNQRKSYLEDLIETLREVMPPTAAIQQQINAAQAEIDTELNPKIEALEAYQDRLNQIEDDLRAHSPAAMM